MQWQQSFSMSFGSIKSDAVETWLRSLCCRFFESIGAKVDKKGKLLHIKLPEDSPFEWDGSELIVGFEKDACEAVQGALLFTPGSLLFHRVHEWLREHALHIAVNLPEIKKPSEPKLRFGNCDLVSVRRRKVCLRGLLVSVALSCMPAFEKAILKKFMVLENGFVAEVTEKVDSILSDAEPTKPLFSRSLFSKLFGLLTEKCESLLSDWLSELTQIAKERSKAELKRIINYYSSLLGELAIKASNNSQFRHEMEKLIAERDERLREELQRYQPFVSAQVVGIAEVNIPAIEFRFTVSNDSLQLSFPTYCNLYDGTFMFVACANCGSQTSYVNLCTSGHIACNDCILSCSTCGTEYCKSCIRNFCELCNLPVCDECLLNCGLCHRNVCKIHNIECEFCRKKVCKICSIECHICGKGACFDHSISCAICSRGICNDCLQRGIKEMQKCFDCGGVICNDHAILCSTCGRVTCTKCRAVCSTCGGIICTMHAFKANCCSIILCNNHSVNCQSCGKIACLEHIAQCGICGSIVCRLCSNRCIICEQYYCVSCLGRKTVCNLCIRLLNSPERKLPSSLLPHPMPKQILKTRSCRFVATKCRSVYLWRDGLDGLLVVADASGKIIFAKHLNALWLLRHLKKWG
ncbi:MAG: hypothetical protein RMK18_07560 [Armatimonadota bacterium]|nr:hypothetical protein [Armatimonadota bacterium]MCX7776686.1 hypothetical protein [Armatimonadota bacterium]MDW8025699.1 hypothetical protein [Armatimonadota bacterium]